MASHPYQGDSSPELNHPCVGMHPIFWLFLRHERRREVLFSLRLCRADFLASQARFPRDFEEKRSEVSKLEKPPVDQLIFEPVAPRRPFSPPFSGSSLELFILAAVAPPDSQIPPFSAPVFLPPQGGSMRPQHPERVSVPPLCIINDPSLAPFTFLKTVL